MYHLIEGYEINSFAIVLRPIVLGEEVCRGGIALIVSSSSILVIPVWCLSLHGDNCVWA